MANDFSQPSTSYRSRIRTAAGVQQVSEPAPALQETAPGAEIKVKIDTTPVVDAIGEIEFRGVVIPHAWFKHIRTPAGAPHPLAVMILADIVHFYKPSEKQDAETGRLTVHKKFRGQKLQRRNSDYVRMFGYSKSQVLRAVHQLVELGLVTQEVVEHLVVNDVVYNNVQYLEPVPARVAEITHYAPELEEHLKRQRQLRESGRTSEQSFLQPHRDTTPAVDAIERINLTGNVLPPMWFKHIKTEAGGPYLLAVMILAELIYWYRPDVRRDPDTLAVVEINKRFDGHRYRLRNTSYADHLGVSHDQVYRAIHRLADLGLITHELNREEGNVQYVEPVPGRIEAITFEAPGGEAPGGEAPGGEALEAEALEVESEAGGGLRAGAPGLRAVAPPLRAHAPGSRASAPPLRADAPGLRAHAPDLTRVRTTNTKTSSTRISAKISSKNPTQPMSDDDDMRAERAKVLEQLDGAGRGIFGQLEALLGHYQLDGVNRIDLAHRLTRRASQIDGPGEWRPMAYRIANCWRKCLNLHKAGRVGDAGGFTGFFVYKLRGMDSEYVAQAGEIDAGRAQFDSADSVALAKQIEQALALPTSTNIVGADEKSRPRASAKSGGKPALAGGPHNGLTHQHPSQADHMAFATVRRAILNDPVLKHLVPLLARIELLACDGTQFVVRAPDISEVSLSPATLEIIIAKRLEDVLQVKLDAVDVRVVE